MNPIVSRFCLPALTVLSIGLAGLPGLTLASEIRLPAYESVTLANGAVLNLMVKDDVPLVALDITLRAGSLADPPGKEGTSGLLTTLMQKGAGDRDGAAFANAVDAVGGQVTFGSGRETLGMAANFMAAQAELMVELAADALRRPQLTQAEFDKVRERAIQSIKATKDSGPDRLIGTYGYAWLFRDHPYGRPSQGSETSLAAISHADVVGFHRSKLGGDRLIISVVGDFDRAAMRQLVEKAFGDWPAASDPLPAVAAKSREAGRRVLLVDKPGATQTYFWIGNVGAAIDDPQREAQDLVQTLFGGRFTSMLNSELRVKSGLTYGARAAIERLQVPGAASMYSFTRTEATVQAIDLMLQTLDTLHAGAIDQAALDSGRNYVIGQFAPTLETAGQLASKLSELSLYGQGREEIDQFGARLGAVDVAATQAAASVFSRSADQAIVLIGDAKLIREQVAKYGPITEHSLAAEQFLP